MKNRIANAFGIIAVVILFTAAFVLALKHFASVSYVTYYESNEGYIPVEFTPCEVQSRTERKITVTFKGNDYSCYVERESTISKGDVIWCGFASYEGNLELIDIHY